MGPLQCTTAGGQTFAQIFCSILLIHGPQAKMKGEQVGFNKIKREK